MKKIYRYLFLKNFNTAMIILAIITILLLVMQSLRFFDLVINRGFPISTLAYISVLTLPKVWVELLPFVIIITTIFTWNQMINNYEIIIMRAVGISSWQLASVTMFLGFLFSLVSLFFNGWIIPKSYYAYFELRNQISNHYNLKLIEPGKFNDIGNNITFYVKQIKSNEFYNVIIYSERDPQKPVAVYAEKGYIDLQDTKLVLLLDKASIIENNMADKTNSFFSVDKYLFDFPLEVKKSIFIRATPDKLYLNELIFDYKEILLKTINPSSKQYADMVDDVYNEIVNIIANSLLPFLLSIIAVYFFTNSSFQRSGNISPLIHSVAFCITLKLFTVLILVAKANLLITIAGSIVLPTAIALLLYYRIIFPPSLKKLSSK